MSHQPLGLTVPAQWESGAPALPSLTRSQCAALDRLTRAFNEKQSLAIVTGEGKSCSSVLIDRFLGGVGSDVTVVRISAPCADETTVMREVIHGIGFESKGLSLTDLENVFAMFLSFQQTHNNRTILCIEETHNCGLWVLDKIRCLVELENQNQFGLMVIMSGRPRQHDDLDNLLLNTTGTLAELEIALAPLSLAETREYVRSRLAASGISDIAQVFEFDAITLIHDLSKGVMDAVSNFYAECMKLADDDTGPITPQMVRIIGSRSAKPDVALVAANVSNLPNKRIIVRMNETVVQELPLNRGHILIGRDKLCDIQIPIPSVSRHHALILNSSTGITIIDLGSTNGTYIDGSPIKHFELNKSGLISIGDCSMDYVAGDDVDDHSIDIEHPVQAEPYNDHFATQNLRCDLKDSIKGNINAKGEKIYHVFGTASYNVTKIDESKGERWFQSEEEAVAAGWRAARS